jgi:2-polyprenyl-6-methoxyphenol hydroxylase-like FAD-dependent oxidoreductase
MFGTKIAIIGASIAGSACATLLHRAGFNIKIFEQRAQGTMDDRGTGIGMPRTLIEQLIDNGLIAADIPKCCINRRQFFVCNPSLNHLRLLMEHSIAMDIIHWGYLYQQLVKQVPVSQTYYKHRLIAIEKTNNRVNAHLSG